MLPESSTASILKNLEDVGVTPPADLQKIREAEQAIDALVNAKPTTGLVDAIYEGKLTPKQLTTQATDAAATLVYAEKLRDVRNAAAGAFEKRRRRLLRDHGAELIEALRVPFDQAAASLVSTIEIIGVAPNVKAVQSQAGPAAAVAWSTRTEAEGTLGMTRRIVNNLATVGYGNARMARPVARYVAEAKGLDELDRAGALLTQGWTALAAEFALRLNTPEEAEKLEAGARSVTDEAERAVRVEANASANRKIEREADFWKGTLGKTPRLVQPDAAPVAADVQ